MRWRAFFMEVAHCGGFVFLRKKRTVYFIAGQFCDKKLAKVSENAFLKEKFTKRTRSRRIRAPSFTVCSKIGCIIKEAVFRVTGIKATERARTTGQALTVRLGKDTVFMIELQHVVKRYGTHYALDDVSLSIKEGEIVGLLGPNGAGKSTAMNILTGYLSATAGQVTVDGCDVTEKPLSARKKIGYLPEQPPLYTEMTVEEYLRFVYSLKGCTLNRKKHLDEIMKMVQITDVRNRLIAHLSKGYRQRVGIAQALIGNPPLLIFDEPTVGLDPKQVIEIRSLLRALGRKHTVLLSTHILSEVQAVCQRVVIINRGRIIANERTDDMARTLDGNRRYKLEIVGPQREILSRLRAKNGVRRFDVLAQKDGEAGIYELESEKGIDIRKSVFYTCAEANWPILEMTPVGEDLESIFVRLVDKSEHAAKAKRN